MIRLRLLRGRSTDEGTPGALLRANGSRLAYTLELPWRDNRRQRSCIPTSIPPGAYTCRQVWSPHFGRVYHVERVPGRDSVLIHSANFAGDVEKGFKTHLLGCIAVGFAFGHIGGQFALLNSMPARTRLQTEMAGKPFELEIEEWISGLS